MYPVLILREELVCFLVLIFLFFMSRAYLKGRDSSSFTRLVIFALLHVIFDIVTILTVNNTDRVPVIVNDICHVVFYITAILYTNELLFYIVRTCYPNSSGRLYKAGYVVVGIFIACVPALGIEYVEMKGTYLSLGYAAYGGFTLAFLFLVAATVVLFVNFRRLKNMVKFALLPMIFVLFASILVQVAVPEMLFTGGGITVVTVAFFFSIENPVHFFRQKAMTDALTGVLSRHSYETDIEAIEERFRKRRDYNYILAFCDINNLKAVNGMFGHSEGDNYIAMVASVLTDRLKHAEGIYRMGGDEFFVVFHNVDEDTVSEECRLVQNTLLGIDTEGRYTPSVAIGYAKAGPDYSSIRDVVRTADYIMYRNKAEMKEVNAMAAADMGTRLNLTGLTDYMFDAICSADNHIYPYVCNLETNITRIPPAWNEYFDMGAEFSQDFSKKWAAKIHPDDLEKNRLAFSEVMNGRRKYFKCEYRAINRDKEYVRCTSHGSIFKGENGKPDVFAGYLINHGVQEKIDAITGFGNGFAINERFIEIVNEGKQAVIIQMIIDGTERIDMMYGYLEGRNILKEAACVVSREVGDDGEVFTDKGSNIAIVLYDMSREDSALKYSCICDALAGGVKSGERLVPMNVFAGAADIRPGADNDRDTIRSKLIFAADKSRYNRSNKLVFIDELDEQSPQANLELLTAIYRDAAGGLDNFYLKYQPIVDTQSGVTVGAEALLRWRSRPYGEVLPGKFIDFIETDPCFYNMGLWIIRQAVRAASIVRINNRDFVMSVNVTALQMRNDGFKQDIMSILSEMGYPPECLTLELTERSKELDTDYLKKTIKGLRSEGVQVAFDDMGTGYSTINLLLNIPVDKVKLDGKFVRKLQEEESYQIYAEALTESYGTTGTMICFEGVETKETHDFLKKYGNSYCQGYLFGKPMSLKELLDFTNGAVNGTI
ncbi:MAG: EAL domain-containing protein [Lentihominibacter sp.]